MVREFTGLGVEYEIVGLGLIAEYAGNEPGISRRLAELFENLPHHNITKLEF